MSIPYYDCIAHHAMRRPDSLAAVDLATGRHHTYQAFDERIARLAGSLRRTHGIAPGDRVAMLAPNTTDTFEVQFACGRIGAIFVPLNWRLANPELRAILADCTPAMLVYDPEFAERAQDLRSSLRHRPLGFAWPDVRADRPRRTLAGPAGRGDPGRHRDHSLHFRHDRAAQGRDHYAWHEFLEHRALHGLREHPALDRVPGDARRCSIPAGSTCSPIRCSRPAAP